MGMMRMFQIGAEVMALSFVNVLMDHTIICFKWVCPVVSDLRANKDVFFVWSMYVCV